MKSLLHPSRRNIVVIGASAGGIDPLRTMLKKLPVDSRASFFVVVHLSPQYPSQLDRILQSCTAMPVMFASDQQVIMPDTVYVAVQDRHLMIEPDRIRVTRGPRESRSRPAIDVLFRSAALAFDHRVIGIVLSGALDDGTAGLWQIKDQGGLALVQDPEEAEYPSMPDSAIEHVDVDFVGTIDALVSMVAEEVNKELPARTVEEPQVQQKIENAIALGEVAMHVGSMDIGKPSNYTCPECGGNLAQIEEGRLVRFRCHTGHAYSIQSLLMEINRSVDMSLWTTARVIEERIIILRQLADLAEKNGKSEEALGLRIKASQADEKCQPLRELVLDDNFFAED